MSGDLDIAYGTDDTVTVVGQYAGIGNRIEAIAFANGAVMTQTDLDALPVAPITGTEQNDTLAGTDYAETLLGLDCGLLRRHGAVEPACCRWCDA